MKRKKKRANKVSATSFAASTPLPPLDLTTMVSFGLMMKRRFHTRPGVYIRLGRCVLKLISTSSLSAETLRPMFRNTLLAILICHRFYKLNLPAHSVWLLKAQLSAISRLVKKKYSTCSTEDVYSEVMRLSQRKENLLVFQLFPRVLSVDTSQSVTSIARYLLWINFVYIRDLSSYLNEMESKK